MISLLRANMTLILWFWLYFGSAFCADLLPYGPNHPGDMTTPLTDDSYVTIALDAPFQYYGTAYTEITATTNGFLAFDGTYTSCCGRGIPFSNQKKVMPVWDDLYPGTLYYRQSTTDASDQAAVFTHIKTIYGDLGAFQPTLTLVVTWDKFSLFADRNIENTFQAVLTTDGTYSFAVFLYYDVEYVTSATVGVDAGDQTNYFELCISETDELLQLESIRQSSTSEPGSLVFRIDSVNPNQESYVCTSLVPLGSPEASYYCKWSDATETTIDVYFIIQYSMTGINAYDTQKFEAGENPYLNDPACETLFTNEPTTTFTFNVDPNAATPSCGVSVTGTSVKILDITIRAWNGDIRFDTKYDRIYRFTCDTDTVLLASAQVNKDFRDTAIESLNILDRSVELQVVSPGSGILLPVVKIGQLIQLRIIYDNTATNSEPYGVYVEDCSVAGTADFDLLTVEFITDGCVVEQDAEDTWYMSRSFRETSLSETGLFITDSGTMTAVRYRNQEKLFFRCVIKFCFFASGTAPNLCTNSCPVQRKRSAVENGMNQTKVINTSVRVAYAGDNQTESSSGDTCEENFSMKEMFIVSGLLGVPILIAFFISLIIFRKILQLQNRK